MKVTYVDHMGSDLTVVNAARVSFAKKSEWVEKEVWEDLVVPTKDVIKVLSEADTKLINYLAKHNHWTPFAHCQLQIHVKAPIFVARQLVKHQIGLVWNEVSRRYVSDEPEFYWPNEDEWRLKAENKKQGSSDEVLPEHQRYFVKGVNHAAEQACLHAYKSMLQFNIAPEMARMVLPLNMYTEWYWTGSLAAWARVCKLRLDPHAQKETQDIAKQIAAIMEAQFPVSWNALLGATHEGN